MSNVPKSRRHTYDHPNARLTEKRFKASSNLVKLRRMIDEICIHRFGYKEKELSDRLDRSDNYYNLVEGRMDVIVHLNDNQIMREKMDEFYPKIIETGTFTLRKLACSAMLEFEFGNSIFPNGETRIMEYCERRKHLNTSIGYLKVLKSELMYIIESLPVRKKRIVELIVLIDETISIIKGVRQKSKRLLKKSENLENNTE